MDKFIFASKHKTILYITMAIGIVCLGITFFIDDQMHSRFWSNILHNTVFFMGISLLAYFLYSAHHIGYSGWQTVFKRLWEAQFAFLLPGLIIFVVLGIGTLLGFHHLYHWSDSESVAHDPILNGKSGFLNPYFYIGATVIIGGVWLFLAGKLRSLSMKEDTDGTSQFRIHKIMRKYAAASLPIIGFGSAALIWLWVMSIDSHWYSTLFAWYSTASLVVSTVAITLLMLYWIKSLNKGYFEKVTDEHIHDLGKYLFAFSIFWTYLWFSQYMLIWYGNVGEETVYFYNRQQDYPVLFYANLVINFVLPFFVLMRNDTKRKKGSVIFAALFVLFGHWLDFFLMIKPGVLHTVHELSGHGTEEVVDHVSSVVTGFTYPGLLEIGTMIGFLGLFLFFVLQSLTRANLTPSRDPYLQESLHHHV